MCVVVLRDILSRLKNQETVSANLQKQLDAKNAEIGVLQEQLKDTRVGCVVRDAFTDEVLCSAL